MSRLRSEAALPIPYVGLPQDRTFEQDARDWLDAELSRSLPAETAAGVIRQVVYGYAAGALLEEAGADDLIAVGSRGHGGFSSLLLGSVAIETATHARGSVVVMKRRAS